MKPERVQRKRTKGWRLPPNTVYVGRPTKWGNPFKAEVYGRDLAVTLYRLAIIRGDFSVGAIDVRATGRSPLRGKNLACWCPIDEPCHADVLLEATNGRSPLLDSRLRGNDEKEEIS